MEKELFGVVFALAADDENDGMAHIWVRDAETAYWFSLSRAVDASTIEVRVSDHLSYRGDDVSVTLSVDGILVKLGNAAGCALDGNLQYVIELHPESQDMASIREALHVIFRGKSGLLLDTKLSVP